MERVGKSGITRLGSAVRILYFSRDYTTHDHRFLAKISERHELFFLRLEDDGVAYEERPVPDGVRVVSWVGGSDRFTTPESWLRLMPAYQQVIEQVRPDLIHAGPVQSCGFMTALLRFRPFLLMSWGSDLLVDAERDELWKWLSRYALRAADMLACDSQEVAAKAVLLADYPEDRIIRFPWGIDLSRFKAGPDHLTLRSQWGWQDEIVLISTRRWAPGYGVHILLDAFRLARQSERRLRLVMVGDGPLAPAVDEYIASHGLSTTVFRTGMLSQSELPHYFRAADAYLSCAQSDGSSISLLEAMACGLPVVATDRASNREWIEPGVNGFLGVPNDARSFAAAILKVAALSPDSRAEIAATNQRLTEKRADWDRNAAKLIAAYYELGAQAGNVRP